MPTDQGILFVCTGNICRSAYAQYRLRLALQPLGDQRPRILSRGTYVNAELRPPQKLTGIVPLDTALELSRHVPRQLGDRDVQDASVILTASEEHLADALRRAPVQMKRAFTLTEFARAANLAGAGPRLAAPGADRWETLRQVAAAHRSGIRAELREDLNIADPYGRDAASYQTMIAAVDRCIDDIAGFLLADSISTASSLD